jgi:hypothetical protein
VEDLKSVGDFWSRSESVGAGKGSMPTEGSVALVMGSNL